MKSYFRKIMLIVSDIILVNMALFLALIIRFDADVPQECIDFLIAAIIPVTLIKITVFFLFRLYSSLWKYASIDEMINIMTATIVASVLALAYGWITDHMQPRSVYFLTWLLTFLFIGASRMGYRVLRRIRNKGIISFIRPGARKRVMVVGAGNAGSMVIKEIQTQYWMESMAVAVIDDEEGKHNSRIHGIPIVGGCDKLIEAAKKYNIGEIIIAIPSATKQQMKEILRLCIKTDCKLRILPGMDEIINGKVNLKKVRDVDIEDLLGRDEVKLNTSEISGYLEDETVLVTGGGGSIGSELCRQIAKFKPKKLVIVDIYENNAYELQNELESKYKGKLEFEVLIASVRDKGRLDYIFRTYKPGVVFHAAAHKHVPLMETSPTEAIKNNIFGTINTAECAEKHKVKKFVLVSTDKAVNPTNIMGASKRVAEMVIQSMSKYSKTEFTAVRFGNVLGSNGSVIPLFKKQVESGGPVKVTHPEITRYFMTIPEAARLVIQAGAMAKGGEVFILDMGDPVKILDLARHLIRLSGLRPDKDIKIEFTGLRRGEKLYEELLTAEEGVSATKHEKIYVSKPVSMDAEDLRKEIDVLNNLLTYDHQDISSHMERLVPTYLKTS